MCLTSNSQQLQEQISLSFKDAELKEVITLIEAKTNYQFFYIEDWVALKKISGTYDSVTVEHLLNEIFKSTVVNYYVLDDRIILTKNSLIHDDFFSNNTDKIVLEENVPDEIIKLKNKAPVIKKDTLSASNEILKIGKEEKNVPTQNTFKLTGYVKNDKTGAPIPDVIITIKDEKIGTTTNTDGFYSLDLPQGRYTVEAKSLKTKNRSRRVSLFNNGTLNFSLTETYEQLEEVFLEAEVDRNVKEPLTGVTKIEVEEIKNIPLVLGERDILKVATTLPGITNTGEGSNGYNVRGGKTDQNLILLDEASIYNPSHLFGIFSALNPFVTGEVEIYKGNIPAEYGGRLSSVFDIKTKDANTKEFAGEGSIGPVTSNLTLELPVVKDKAALMVGGRATYSRWILRSLDDESLQKSQASFYDVVAKYNHKINENNDVKLMAYYSKDKFSITSDSLYTYSNRLASVKWKHKFNEKLKSDLIVTNSEYQFDITYDGNFNNDFDLGYKNTETEVKLRLDHKAGEELRLNYGLSSKLYKINPGDVRPLNQESVINPISLEQEKGLESAVFLTADYNVSEKLAVSAGIRYSYFAFLGDATQRIYESNLPLNNATLIETKTYGNNEFVKTYDGIEARLSARYFINDELSLKASYNNTYQYIHTLSTNTTVSPTDTWKLSDINIKPQEATQYAFGVYKNIKDNMYELSIEGYYKTSNNILDYKVGANLFLNEVLEQEVLQGEGRAYGVEFLLRKTKGRLNGWLGYTYSRSQLKLDSEFAEERVNNGQYFSANFDKPHDLSIVANYKLTKRFSFSANFVYQTGRPVTYPVGTYIFNGAEYVLYSDRNKFRIPDYYRLDIGFNVEGNHKLKKLAHSFWNISIYNVLARNNPYSVYFVTEAGEIKAYKSSIFAIPIPTITYNFKF